MYIFEKKKTFLEKNILVENLKSDVNEFSLVNKGGFKSEDVEGFSNLPKYIPFFYPKLA